MTRFLFNDQFLHREYKLLNVPHRGGGKKGIHEASNPGGAPVVSVPPQCHFANSTAHPNVSEKVNFKRHVLSSWLTSY